MTDTRSAHSTGICVYPDWEGGLIQGKHVFDKDGCCIICGEGPYDDPKDNIRPARPVHPGAILRREMEARWWTDADIATDGCPPALYALLRGEGRVDGDTAFRLAMCFGTSIAFWLNLQMQYDEAVAAKEEKP